MTLLAHKTKIVCTIGPASQSVEVMRQMLQAGMNVARLNFSHGDFAVHGEVIANLRAASQATGQRVCIMADLPGPKMRIGKLAEEPIQLVAGQEFVLTTQQEPGNTARVSVSFLELPQKVKPGDTLYLNDGFIQLEVLSVKSSEVVTRVVVGGELRSKKGLNLPGIKLGISAFTQRDRECLAFVLQQGVEAVSQSFVESAEDIAMVREAAKQLGRSPMIIAKIERAQALVNLNSILEAADGIMIARGDLGVEIPIEEMAVVQKKIMRAANLIGKPVITATHMLESMIESSRPTRAEATDVANAILDGTDCVMLSGESAVGKHPIAAVEMLGKIAAAIEPHRLPSCLSEHVSSNAEAGRASIGDVLAASVQGALEQICAPAVIIPSRSGATARRLARYRLPVWITAVSSDEQLCQQLQFYYGVYPICLAQDPDDWRAFAQEFLRKHNLKGEVVIVTQGPSAKRPQANYAMEVVDLRLNQGSRTAL